MMLLTQKVGYYLVKKTSNVESLTTSLNHTSDQIEIARESNVYFEVVTSQLPSKHFPRLSICSFFDRSLRSYAKWKLRSNLRSI